MVYEDKKSEERGLKLSIGEYYFIQWMIKKDLSAAWLLDITHTQTHTDEGCPAKFELQISNKYFSIQVFPVQYWGHTYTKTVFIIYLKFKLNWVSCIYLCKSANLAWTSLLPWWLTWIWQIMSESKDAFGGCMLILCCSFKETSKQWCRPVNNNNK